MARKSAASKLSLTALILGGVVLLLGAFEMIYIGHYQGTGEADQEMIEALPIVRMVFICGIVVAVAGALGLALGGRATAPARPRPVGGGMSAMRLIGVVVSLLGGAGLILFGGSAATVHQQMFFSRADEMAATNMFYALTAVSVLVLIVGLVMIGRGGGGSAAAPPPEGGGPGANQA